MTEAVAQNLKNFAKFTGKHLCQRLCHSYRIPLVTCSLVICFLINYYTGSGVAAEIYYEKYIFSKIVVKIREEIYMKVAALLEVNYFTGIFHEF